MIKINSPFKLIEPPPRYLGLPYKPASFAAPVMRELVLAGLRVCLQLDGGIYELSSASDPAGDGFRARGFGWGHKVVPLRTGVSLEQQMLLGNGGSTVALSWRLTGERLLPISLTATPVFTAKEPTSSEPFKFDSDSDGGRLSWQPYHLARRIIADTNGRCSAPANPDSLRDDSTSGHYVSTPAAFTFDLGRRPAVLIFSVEPEENSSVDPFLGGFLAELAQPGVPSEGEYLRSLAAA